jgi:DNA-binding NarL/FixJ family response regulator
MSDSQPIRIFFVDDHPLIREGMARVVEAEPDMEVVGEAGCAEEALVRYRELRPDVALIDLRMRGMDGIELVTAIRREFADARLMILSTSLGDEHIFRAVEAGARCYLSKDTDAEELVRYIRLVHHGRRTFPPEVAARLAERVGSPALSAREREVLVLMARGLRNKEIAVELNISEQTAQTHVRSILAKLDVNDRTEAVTRGLRRGIIELEE